MSTSPSQEEKSQRRENEGNNAPSHPKTVLQITIPPLKPPTTSQSPTPNNQPPKTDDTQVALKATSPPSPSIPPSSSPAAQSPPGAIIFREIPWDRGKTSPASSISAHSPHSDTMGRVPYISPSACASKREAEGDRSPEEVVRTGGKEQRKQARVVPWLRDIEGQDGEEMKMEVEGRVGRRRI